MKDLRIVFMGTPEFAVTTLKKIIENNYNVVGVVTAPDKPAGRGRKITQSAVKEYAVSQEIPVLQPKNLKSAEFNQELKALAPDVQVVVAFRMLPKVVWQLPTYGSFNLHASLLPQYRGAAPINWALINGEKETGVSTFFLDDKIDTGAMILQDKTQIDPEENVGSLHDKLMLSGADLVIKTLVMIEEGSFETTAQQESEFLKEAPKLTKENTQIDWSKPGKTIYDHIRGLSPYPSAWSSLHHGDETLRCKIRRANLQVETHQLPIGTLFQEGKTLKVAVKDGFISLEEIQLPGKRNMQVKELLNGFSLKENAYMR